jgi:DNA replication and repair protein RecF
MGHQVKFTMTTDRTEIPALAVRRLTVTQFRCYERARVETDGRPVVLTGPNGAGKTNLLEALSFLAPGRGLRRAALADIGRRQAPPGTAWGIAAEIETPSGPVAIGTGLDPVAAEAGGFRRIVRIDGRPADSQAALGAHVTLTWLTPQLDRLFLEGAGNRRRFLDRLVFNFHPDHAGHLTAYEQSLRERARLLKDGRRDDDWLAALEDSMAANAVAIAAARREMVDRLRAAESVARFGGADGDDFFPRAELALSGAVEGWLADAPALAVEEMFRDRLARTRALDAVAGGAADGPHRSDLLVRHAGQDIPASDCSTGEQKALLVGIVLANARLLTAERGAPPLLLLDEIAAHLDSRRRAALFEEIVALGAQAWLTGTDQGLFAALGDRARHLTIDNARIDEAD